MTDKQNGMSTADIAKLAGAVVVILIAIFIIMRVYKSQQPNVVHAPVARNAQGQVIQPEGPKAEWMREHKKEFDAQLKQQGH